MSDSEEFTADEARRHFARLLGTVEHAGTHITVTRYGRPVAVIVPAARLGTYARVDAALEIARNCDDADGEVINQMVRALTGDTADRLKGSPRSAPGSS